MKTHFYPRVEGCVTACIARFNSKMATLDRWFTRKPKETSDSFNKGSGTARNHASSDDEDRDSILSGHYNTDELDIGCQAIVKTVMRKCAHHQRAKGIKPLQ